MQLKPYFKKGGTVTAGNCCSVGGVGGALVAGAVRHRVHSQAMPALQLMPMPAHISVAATTTQTFQLCLFELTAHFCNPAHYLDLAASEH